MDHSSHHICRSAAGSRRAETVLVPPAHAGVGDALRHAYAEPMGAVPHDMATLLAKLR